MVSCWNVTGTHYVGNCHAQGEQLKVGEPKNIMYYCCNGILPGRIAKRL